MRARRGVAWNIFALLCVRNYVDILKYTSSVCERLDEYVARLMKFRALLRNNCHPRVSIFAYSKLYCSCQVGCFIEWEKNDNLSACFLNVFWLLLDEGQMGQKNTKAVTWGKYTSICEDMQYASSISFLLTNSLLNLKSMEKSEVKVRMAWLTIHST